MSFATYVTSLGGAVHLYANASNAYKDLLEHLVQTSRSTKANVVIPSYLPAKLYRASLAAGCAVRFYDIGDGCTPDVEQLRALIDDDTVAVLAIHYFGFPQALNEIAAITRARGVFLIEDCALTLGATHEGRALGTIGDAALFSVRKMFLYPEGGFLRVGERAAAFQPRYQRRVFSAFSVNQYLKQKAKYRYVRLTGGADPLGLFRVDPLGYMDLSSPQTLSVKMLSAFSEQRLRFADVAEAVRRRRRNFERVARAFPHGPSLTALHPVLPDGVTPYSFPFLVERGARDELRQDLLRAGVVAGAGWPEAPFHDGAPRTRRLAATLLELPVHQALTEMQLERSLSALARFARAGTRRSA